jgi:dTDP-4-amino-4,6-dideoxygalactose transaminase
MKPCTVGISPVPGRNKRKTHKNVMPLNGSPILSWSISVPLKSGVSDTAWHLDTVRLVGDEPAPRWAAPCAALREWGIDVNVHYLPVYLHSSYAAARYPHALFPVAEDAYSRLRSLPMWHGMDDEQVDMVVGAINTEPVSPTWN